MATQWNNKCILSVALDQESLSTVQQYDCKSKYKKALLLIGYLSKQ